MSRQSKTGGLAIVLLLFVGLWSQAVAQQEPPDIVVCPVDDFVNDWSNNYCINCSSSLAEVKKARLEEIAAARAGPPLRLLGARPATLEAGMSKHFHLRDGNVLSGTILRIEKDSIAVIETPEGVLRVPKQEILEEVVDIVKVDDTRFTGPVLSDDDNSISVKTPYGTAVVLKRDVRSMDRYYGDKKLTWEEERRRFFAGEELTDIFLDPTAFPLRPHVFYVSGLSLGYGFTESFMLRTQYGYDFVGDLNLHPLIRVFHGAGGRSAWAISVGAKLFSHHRMQAEARKYTHWLVDSEGTRLDDNGAPLLETVLKDPEEQDFFWQAYLVFSRRQSLASGRGKWGWHLGAATNSFIYDLPELNEGLEWQLDTPYRVWLAMDYDLTKRLKFLIEVFADNGHKFVDLNETGEDYLDFEDTPFALQPEKGDYRPVDLDFGFTYSVNEALRLGVHFQAPFLTVYWKFYEL
ncbi:MAG: hypothetical protein JSW58_16090 [Candidatus Latescibacterota bacterium]|nr:MAG: hypothetical protein JSW58_16090 [Candidatus Latescibacterota bacterium]